MLLPSLGKAKETAKQIGCNSNMRQIGQLQITYTHDFNDFFIPISGLTYNGSHLNSLHFAFTTPVPWFLYLSNTMGPENMSEYIKFNHIFLCPSETTVIRYSDNANTNYPRWAHYVLNQLLSGVKGGASDGYTYHTTKMVEQPSHTVMTLESRKGKNGTVSIADWAFRHGGGYNPAVEPSKTLSVSGKMNTVMSDGHVEPFTWQQIMSTPTLPKYGYGNSPVLSFLSTGYKLWSGIAVD